MPPVQGPQPCAECGTILVKGPEPLDPDANAADWETGQRYQLVEWCPNLDCPSNHVLKGLRQVGANRYLCTTCGEEIGGSSKNYLGHRRTH
jgi:DNA-directed RNA polymerase subunit RPC12/RpoP